MKEDIEVFDKRKVILKQKLFYNLLILFFILTISFTNFSYSQLLPGGSVGSSYSFKDDEEVENPSTFAEINIKAPQIAGQWGIELGLSLGGYLSKNFSLGLEFDYLFTQTISFSLPDDDKKVHLRLVYGGINFDGMLPLSKDFVVSSRLSVLLGNASYGSHSSYDIASDPSGKWCFFWSIDAGLDYRIAKQMFLSTKIGWRSPFAFDYVGLTEKDMQGMFLRVGIKSVF